MIIEIKDIFGKVIYSSEALNIVECLKNAIKDNADLSNADLSYVNLRYVNLSNADLRNADLRYVNLSNADLRNADLRYVNLYDANFNNISLKEDIKINNKPIQITSNEYYIFIYDNHMKIGCEFHSFDEWFTFDDKKIISMDGKKALYFWNNWKEPLKQICKNIRNY